MHPIELAHTWKRYRMHASHDSLRDAIPALIRRWWGLDGRARGVDEFWALRDVSFHVARGETLGIIGHNGAGKSTVLKLLSKIIYPTRGTVKVRGRLTALIELGGGFHDDLTGAENIYLQGTMLGLSRRQVRERFDSIVAFSELEEFLQMPVKRYSSGMEARLGFAIAAHLEPEVLLLDEVLAVGDLAFQQKCFRRIGELRTAGTTIIFISHNLEAVQSLCDRVLVLQQGHLFCEGKPREVIRRYHEEVRRRTAQDGNGFAGKDRAISICGVSLKDHLGAPLNTLETGQAAQIEVEYEAARPIQQPIIHVSLERADGLLCHTASSRHAGGSPHLPAGKGRISVSYRAVNLLPNLYQVTVRLFEGNSPIPLASVEQGCFFQVTSDYQEPGAVHLEHAWDFKATAR